MEKRKGTNKGQTGKKEFIERKKKQDKRRMGRKKRRKKLFNTNK